MPDLQITYPEDLPVSQRRDEILEAIRNHQVVVIAGATGSGKTTQLPKMCLELGRTSIAHTQPRRIAARAVAERISEELKVELGGLVGYQVRFTDKVSAETKVKVMTDGILLNAMQRHRNLEQYDTIIIDEAHERSLNIDFLLGYLKQLLPKRPDLKVIVTSATIDPESFSKHFNDAPIIEVSGRTFPIEVRYRPTAREAHDDTDPDEETTASDYIDGIIKALKELESEPEGDTLVFLSGESEIRDAQDAIAGSITSGALAKGTEVLPLYGRLSAAEQHLVFQASKLVGVRRRIILATNVAETSLTIPNIKYVIDAGTARISRYSPKAKVQRLPIEAISQASANQRAGRTGRTSPGVVIRLYAEDDFESRPEFTDPEILRTNLASVILQAANLGLGDITQFPFIQPPDQRGVKDGLGLLAELGAVEDAKGKSVRLTTIGKNLARLPIEPRFARMLLEAKTHDLVREVLIIVAGLTIQDPRERPLAKRPQADQMHQRFADPTSDFLSLLNLWNYIEEQQQKLSSSAFRRLCKNEFLNYLRVREWQDLMRQLRSVAKPLGIVPGNPRVDPDGIHKCLLAGLLSQIGLRQLSEKKGADLAKGKPGASKGPGEYLGSNGKKFVIFPGSTMAKKPSAAIMTAELVETSRLFARMNAAIDPAWAEALAGDLCKRSFSEPHWEKTQGSVVAYERVTLFGVPIVVSRRMQYSRIDAELCRELFVRHALVQGEWDSKQQFDRNNRSLMKQLEAEADRARKPQHAPDDDDAYRFYISRIPAEVFSTRTFEGWWRKAKHETPNLLTMTREDLLGEQIAAPDEHNHPTEWSYNGQKLKLRYRFDPAATDDGVSVDVPLPILASLDSDPFDWLVPGMRLELITELIRSLPKSLRKNVVPAADWAAKALAQLPQEPNGNLFSVLAKTLQQLSGTKMSAEDFDVSRLPNALRMTYRPLDAAGRPLGLSVDLKALQAKFAESGRGAVAKVVEKVHSPIERDGLSVWDFDRLEQSVESKHGGNLVRGFPALVAQPNGSVDIRLFSTQSEQVQRHRGGVIALVKSAIASPAKYVESHLAQNEKLAIAGLPYPSFAAFIDDVITAVAAQELEKVEADGLVFTRGEFEKVRDATSAAVVERAFEVSALVTKISVAAREANKAISSVNGFDFLSVLSAEKQHVLDLLEPKFVSAVGLERLPRILVYLQAIKHRIEKLVDNPERDRVASLELDQAIGLYVFAGGKFPLAPDSPAKLSVARWLIEELRVSLFSQALGTSELVSVQRIKKALA